MPPSSLGARSAEDMYYEQHKSSLETSIGWAVDAAVAEGGEMADASGNGPDPMLFVAKHILASHGIGTEGVEAKIEVVPGDPSARPVPAPGPDPRRRTPVPNPRPSASRRPGPEDAA